MTFPHLFTGLANNGAFIGRFMSKFEHTSADGHTFYAFSFAIDLDDGRTVVLSDTDDSIDAYREGDIVTFSNATMRIARHSETGEPVLTELKSGAGADAPKTPSACYRLGQLDPTQPVGIDIRSRGQGVAKVRRRHDAPVTPDDDAEAAAEAARQHEAVMAAAQSR